MWKFIPIVTLVVGFATSASAQQFGNRGYWGPQPIVSRGGLLGQQSFNRQPYFAQSYPIRSYYQFNQWGPGWSSSMGYAPPVQPQVYIQPVQPIQSFYWNW